MSYFGDGDMTSDSQNKMGIRSQAILGGFIPEPAENRMEDGSLVTDKFKQLSAHPFAVPPPVPEPTPPTPLDPLTGLTLSGLIIGDQPKEEVGTNVPDYMYRGFLFKPGTNLAPQFPDDLNLNMTPYCAPQTVRPKQVDVEPRAQVLAKFEPQEKGFDEADGEDDAKGKEVLVMFGKPQPIDPTNCPPSTFETSEESVIEYIEQHSLDLFFEHVLALCVLDFHPEPFEFVADYCGKLIEAREDPEKFNELARVLYPTHVAAVFRVFDKEQNGYVSLNSYRLGMETLGLRRYNPNPTDYQTDRISKDTFYEEGCKSLEMLLRAFMV